VPYFSLCAQLEVEGGAGGGEGHSMRLTLSEAVHSLPCRRSCLWFGLGGSLVRLSWHQQVGQGNYLWLTRSGQLLQKKQGLLNTFVLNQIAPVPESLPASPKTIPRCPSGCSSAEGGSLRPTSSSQLLRAGTSFRPAAGQEQHWCGSWGREKVQRRPVRDSSSPIIRTPQCLEGVVVLGPHQAAVTLGRQQLKAAGQLCGWWLSIAAAENSPQALERWGWASSCCD